MDDQETTSDASIQREDSLKKVNTNDTNAEKDSEAKNDSSENKRKEKELKKEKHMPFTEHLEELRMRLFKCIGSVVGFGLASYIFSDRILQILTRPNPGVQLQILKPTGGFLIHLKVSFFAGVIISIPVLLYQFWQFVAPGLFKKERRFVFPIIVFTVICFSIGALFAYFIVIPFGLQFLLGFETETIIAQWTIDDFISFVAMMVVVFGVVFELPLVALFLGKIGIINHTMMTKYRKHAIFGTIVFGAVLTPPDFITQLALAIPLWMLYEISIILVRIFVKKTSDDDI